MPKSVLDKARGHEVVWQNVSDLFRAGAQFGNTSYVYFIGEEGDGALKIGLAKDPIRRLRQMQTGNPRRLRVEYILIGDRPTERLLHRLWEGHAIKSVEARGKVNSAPRTEWFEPTVREKLIPIVSDAAKRQAQYLEDAQPQDVTLNYLEEFIREAHIEHDHVAHLPDMTHRLGAVSGYAVSRATA